MGAERTPYLETGVDLLASPEWGKFLRHFELGQGFAFIILLAPNRSVAKLCQNEFNLWLSARRRSPVVALPVQTADDLSNLPERLISMPVPAAPIWADGTGAREVYQQAWYRCALKLNRTRDVIAARFSTPVILVGAPWIREILRDTAPDFWSVRAFVAEISQPPPQVTLPPTSTRLDVAVSSDFAFDPDLALRAIADIRGKPGRERQLTQHLDRAGTELMRRGRSEEALALLSEAMELDEAAVRAEPSRTDYLRDLSVSYNKLGDLQSALGNGEAARQFFEKSLAIAERLVQQEPARADYLRDVIVSMVKLGSPNHLQRALDIALDLQKTNRLAKSDEWMVADLQQRLQLVAIAGTTLVPR